MRGRVLMALAVMGWAALVSQGQPAVDRARTPAVAAPAESSKALPTQLDALNVASRKLYAAARTRELSTIPAVIVVAGDDLILRKNDQRSVAHVLPAEYHALKCVAHSTLALCTHLSHEPGRPLGEERLQALTDYRVLLAAAGPAVENSGFAPGTLTRQRRIIARALTFIDAVVKDGKVSGDELTKFCRASRADVLANAADAARAQLLATHKQVMAWRKDMTGEEWASLAVVVEGPQTPRVENAAVQYFARLFGETSGEGRRVVYAEGLWDEEKAVELLGTLRLDGKLSVAVFGDPFRMYRDLLADVARFAIDDILAAP